MTQPANKSLENSALGDGYVPVIDISPYFTDKAEAKQKVADQIGRACREIGFYIIVGHRVSPDLTNRVDRASRDFFDLPVDEKMKLHIGKEASAVGYSALGDRSLAYTRGEKSPPDLSEFISDFEDRCGYEQSLFPDVRSKAAGAAQSLA